MTSIPTLEGLHNGSLGGISGGAQLGRELASGFALDAKRKAEDTMKKRAIHTATSYDDFKNLVACASQTPLASGDFSSRVELGVNRMIGGSTRGLEAPCDLGLASPFATPTTAAAAVSGGGGVTLAASLTLTTRVINWGTPPTSCLELDRAFRRHSTQRRDFLFWLGPTRLGACFRRDVDPAILGTIITLLAKCIREREGEGDGGGEKIEEAVALAVGIVSAAMPSALSRAVDMLDSGERNETSIIIKAAKVGSDAEVLLRKIFEQ